MRLKLPVGLRKWMMRAAASGVIGGSGAAPHDVREIHLDNDDPLPAISALLDALMTCSLPMLDTLADVTAARSGRAHEECFLEARAAIGVFAQHLAEHASSDMSSAAILLAHVLATRVVADALQTTADTADEAAAVAEKMSGGRALGIVLKETSKHAH